MVDHTNTSSDHSNHNKNLPPNVIKNFVLDTNVLLHDSNAIHKFADNTVIIPIYVIEEIDQFKKELSDLGRNARQICRFLDSYRERGNLGEGVRMDNGGLLKVSMTSAERSSSEQHEINTGVLDRHLADNLIMAVALDVQAADKDHPTIFVTKDTNLRVRADAMGLHSENYEETSVSLDDLYPGATELDVAPEIIATFYEKGEISIASILHLPNAADPDLSASLSDEYLSHSNGNANGNNGNGNHKDRSKTDFYPNEYILLRGATPNQNALGRVDADAKSVRTMRRFKEGVWGIRPRNKEQHFALDCLMDDNIQLVTLLGKAGTGKAQPLDAKVLTPSGWMFMGMLRPGDSVMTQQGTPARILATFPQGKLDIYRVTFSDGTSTECCADHLWMTRTSLNRDQGRSGSVKTLREIMSTLKYGAQQKRNHSIPITSPVQFPKRDLPLDPYLLGCLIGDGSLSTNTPALSSADPFLLDTCESLLAKVGCRWGFTKDDVTYTIYYGRSTGAPPMHFIRTDPTTRAEKFYPSIDAVKKEEIFCIPSVYRACKDNNKLYKGYFWRSVQPTEKSMHPVKNALIKLGLMGCKSATKFVPDIYKFSSPEQRIALLQGLMDTDGTIGQDGDQTYSTVSPRLAEDVCFLVQSLGGTATVLTKTPTYTYKGEKKTGQLAYTCHICLPNNIIPFRLPRKVARIKTRTKYHPRRYIESVELVGKKPAQCILIDHPDHLYLTDNCIVTHNTLCAIAAGLQKCIEEKKYHKLLVSRPIFPLGRDIGYLPGTVEEKLNPWMQPIFDNIEYLMGLNETDRRSGRSYREFIELGMLQIEPLTYIRGRSIPQQFMIVDESQNLTPHEVKTILTRAGEGTKIVLTGDPYQIDNPYVDAHSNGLTYIINRFKGQSIFATVTLSKGERSKLAELSANLL